MGQSVLALRPGGSAQVLDFSGRLQRSAELFCQVVWPQVAGVFGPGRLVRVEAMESDCTKVLDLLGIDYLFTPASGEAFGLASRVQAPDRAGRPWDGFTMSVHQYDRLQGVQEAGFGHLVPAVAVQAFLDWQSKLLSVGVARVRELVGTAPTGTRRGPSGPFYVWSFDDLRKAGRLIARFPDPSIADPFTAFGTR